MTCYSYAPQVAEIGRRVIAQYHPELTMYGEPRIEFLFRDEAAKRNGKTIWGTASKVGGRNAFLSLPKDDAPMGDPTECEVEQFFVIEIAFDVWQDLNDKQRVALVDHEICHLSVTMTEKGDIKLGLVGHDLEEFEAILVRHGLFRPDLKSFAIVASEQLTMAAHPGWDIKTGEAVTVPADWSLDGDE